MVLLKKSLFIVFALFTCVLPIVGQQKQKFSIESFECNPFDMTAQNAKLDGSGNQYAIIKVSSTNPDDNLLEYSFNFGNLRSFVEEHDNELWVYVQKNAKTVTISRPGYVTVTRYDLKTTIESAKTYTMLISTDIKVESKQMLQFVVNPVSSKAIVTIKALKPDSKEVVLGEVDENGTIATSLELGAYTYNVIAAGYNVSEGRFTLNDKTTTHVEQIKLYEGKGVESTDVLNEVKFTMANVVDNAVVLVKSDKADSQEKILGVIDKSGKLTKPINVGTYSYKIVAADYQIAYGQLDIAKETKMTGVEVELLPNFSQVTLFVDADADIYVNGDKKGNHTWKGALKAGKYKVECRKEMHRSSYQVIVVKENDDRAYSLTPPTPIAGSLSITSSPSGANVSLNDKSYGVTPLYINSLIEGDYSLSVSHDGYMTKTQKIEIKDGESYDMNIELFSGGRFTFESVPQGADLFIDDKKVGKTPYSEDMLSGDYNIRLVQRTCRDYKGKVHLDAESPIVRIKMQQEKFKKNSFYFQLSGLFGKSLGGGANLGGYIRNFNIEAYATYIFNRETKYYYSINYYDEIHHTGLMIGMRTGYGIRLNNRIRLTPQVGGYHLLVLAGAETHADCITVGARAEYMFSRWFGACINPEYAFAVKKGKLYELYSDASSRIKDWSNGIKLRIGLFVNI